MKVRPIIDKLKKDQQKIVDGPKTILKYWDDPTKALRVVQNSCNLFCLRNTINGICEKKILTCW